MGGIEYSVYSSHPENLMRMSNLITNVSFDELNDRSVDIDHLFKVKSLMFKNIQLRIKNKQYQYALMEINRILSYDSLYDKAEFGHLSKIKGDTYLSMSLNIDDVAKEQALIEHKRFSPNFVEKFKSNTTLYQDSASMEYNIALANNNNSPEIYRGLGIISYNKFEFALAKQYLLEYLNQNNEIPDRRFINYMLDQINLKLR